MTSKSPICEFTYCKVHQSCLFKNASSEFKNNAYSVRVGEEQNSNVINCYNKGLDLSCYENPIKRIEGSDNSWKVSLRMKEQKKGLCENPKCKLGNPVSVARHNNDINLCKSCNDLIHDYKTNHELARYFNSKTKIIKLLDCIRILEKETNEKPINVIRCSNIYCGTELNITQHHLTPKPFRKGFPVSSGNVNEKIPLCEECHKRVHQLKTNTQLARDYSSKESVIALLAGDISFRVMRVLNVNEEMQLMAVA